MPTSNIPPPKTVEPPAPEQTREGMNKKNVLAFAGITVLLLAAGGLAWVFLVREGTGEPTGTEQTGATSEGTEFDYSETEYIGETVTASVPVIAVDNANTPHIIAYETESLDLIYASRTGLNSWEIETVDSEGDIGDGHDLAFDSEGNPHISYRDKTNGSVKYATKVDGSWETETVDPASGEGEHVESSSIAIDSDGNPHIAYNIQSLSEPPSLKYAQWNGDSWDIETPEISGHWVSLALDTNDTPHIAFHSDEDSQVYYTTKLSSGTWEETAVDPATSTVNDVHIAVDSNNLPHITYRGSTGDCPIMYAVWDGSTWDIQTVDNGEETLDELSFALDKDDNPYLIYGVPSEGLILATIAEGDWTFSQIANASVCAIAIDELNHAHIAHTNALNGDDIVDNGEGPVETGTSESETIMYVFVE